MVTDMRVALTERAVGEFETHLRAIGRMDGTVSRRTYWVGRMLREIDDPAYAVTWAELETWLAAHTWKASTRRSVVASLRQFYEWSVTSGARPDNPAAGLASPSEPDPCPRPMPDAVLEAAMARVPAQGQVWWLLRLLSTTGLRRAEAARLCSDDVSGGWIRVTGKGDKTRRVPVPPDVEAWLIGCDGWAFPSPYGGHVTADAVTKRCKRATGMGPHTLRHRYATVMYRKTRNLQAVQKLLGHASIATTQRYLATTDDELLAAASTVWAA